MRDLKVSGFLFFMESPYEFILYTLRLSAIIFVESSLRVVGMVGKSHSQRLLVFPYGLKVTVP